MKKMTFMVMALAMVLGLAQCKKEQPATPQNEGNVVMITLNVGGGNNGTRANVNPTGTDQVTFEDGDQILVASGGKYVGTLTKSGMTFSGPVSEDDLVEDQPLYFYFLGNKIDVETLTAGATEECTVNISDQSNYPHLPVISMGRSIDPTTGKIVKYEEGMTSFTSRLYNKCSLMKFNVTTPSTAAICITGMNNKVTVYFDNPTDSGFEYGMEGEGVIKMKGGSGTNVEKWAIVLPQNIDLPLGDDGSAYSADGNYIGKRPAIAPIVSNTFYNEDTRTMNVNTLSPDGPLATPLTLEALSDGTIKVNSPKSGMQYSLNGGEKQAVTSEAINVAAGNKVQFYCTGTYSGNYLGTTIKDGTAQVKVYGNIMSLVNETGYASATTLTGNAFYGLFTNNDKLTDASGLLLPATTLVIGCYYFMFRGCTSLTAAPALPATMLANLCYAYMFYDCTSLTTAPTLPATTLVSNCYLQMFYGCSSLSSITCLATSGINSSSSTSGWMTNAGKNVTGTKTFTAASTATWPEGDNGIPSTWTRVNVQ
jgi:hypothetical protein